MSYIENIKIIDTVMNHYYLFDDENNNENDINNIIDIFIQINNNIIHNYNILIDQKLKKIFINNKQFHLFLIFSCKSNNVKYDDELELSLNTEDLITLTKYSLIFDNLDCFKEWFFKLDDKLQSYILHYLNLNNPKHFFKHGYPLQIINYLIDNDYDNIINYNYIICSLDLTKKNNCIIYFNYDKSLKYNSKKYDPSTLLLELNLKVKNLIRNLIVTYKKNYNNQFYCRYTTNICHIIKLFYDNNHVTKEDLIKYIGHNIYLINLFYNYEKLNDIIIEIGIKKFKYFLINKKCLINNLIINKLNNTIFIYNIIWFNSNFIKFNDKIKLSIFKKYNKLNLLQHFISIDNSNIIITYDIFKYTNKSNPNITININKNIIEDLICNAKYKTLELYFNKIPKNIIIIKNCLKKYILFLLNNKKCFIYSNKLKCHKALNFYKLIDQSDYDYFLNKNLIKINKELKHKDTYKIIIKNKLINFDEKNIHKLIKNILIYFNKFQISRLLYILPLNIFQTINIYIYLKNRFVYNYTRLKKLLKQKFNISDETIDTYI